MAELLIAGAVGVLGYVFSRSERAPVVATRQRVALDLDAVRPGTYPFDSAHTQVNQALLKQQEKRSEERYQLANDPRASGIVSQQYPHFSSYRKQHTNDDLKQRRMETHTGTLEGTDWNRKVEAPNMFQPMAQPVTSSGSSGNGANYGLERQQNAVSQLQNNVMPFQQIRVGPGVGVDPNVPSADGFHPMYRVLPPDANSYRKNELPGSVIPGAAPIAMRTVDPKYYTKGVPRYWHMAERRPLEKGRAAATAQMVRPLTEAKGCHVDTQEYYGIAGKAGQNVSAGTWSRNKEDGNINLHVTNASGARAGVGGFVGAQYDMTRFEAQKRETPNDPSAGVVTGNQYRHQAPNSFVVSPTNRALAFSEYGGIAGHFVNTGETRPMDQPQPTLREQLHDKNNGGGIAAPTLTGATVQCTDKQLLKEAKRGGYVVNTYGALPERTDALRRAAFGGNYDLMVNRCQGGVAIRPEIVQPERNPGHGSYYINNAQPGASTTANRNKLESVNRFQDFGIAKAALEGNQLHIALN